MIEKESFYFFCKSFWSNILSKEGINKILKLNILILFHRLNDTWTKMCLLVNVINNLVDCLIHLFFLLHIMDKKSLPIFISLIKDFQQFSYFILIFAIFNEVLSLQIKFIVFWTWFLKFTFKSIWFISRLDNLLLEEDFVSIIFVNLELLSLYCFLMHFTHVSKE